MGICMGKDKHNSKISPHNPEHCERNHKIQYLDYPQWKDGRDSRNSMKDAENTTTLKGINKQNIYGQTPMKKAQYSADQTAETQASQLTAQKPSKDNEKTISSGHRESIEATRSNAMTPAEILKNLRQKHREK